MSENIEEIKAFYQDCNKLLKDITIEWIKEDGSIGETIKGDEVLEYIEKTNQKSYGNNCEYGICYNQPINIRYKCLYEKYDFNNQYYKLFGFQSLKNDTLEIKQSILCGTYNDYGRDYNICAEHKEYKENLQSEFIKYKQSLLSIITMILNCIDFKFYKFSNENLFINSITNLSDSYVKSNRYTGEQIYYTNIQPFYKTLQIKYNSDIIFIMTISNYKTNIYENDIFNCMFNHNDKIINFNLIDFYTGSINYYNNFYHQRSSSPGNFQFYSKNINFLNQPYGQRVFYNVIYSLENKLINQVSETSKNQDFINNQNHQDILLQKNQEIEELKLLLQEKTKFNEIQDNLIKILTETLNTFKEKSENQIKIHQEEFEKLKLEHIEKYNETFKKFNKTSEQNKKLIDDIDKLKE